jgi:hypothetical protein
MKETSNKYALAALRERRAELAGEIKTLESRLRHIRDSLVHVDATLRLFDPDGNPNSIRPKRPYKRVKLFGQGKLNRLILDALRKSTQPLRTQEVIDAIAAAVDFGPDAANGLKGRVRSNLTYLARVRGAILKDGDRETATWRVV